MNVTVVTVTYGKRAHLLTQVLDAAREQGVVKAVVIDNGSADPVAAILTERYGEWAFVHAMSGNTGSALGFKTGIELALARGAEFLLLLDDDNVLGPECLKSLLDAFLYKSAQERHQDIAVFGYRRSRHEALVINSTRNSGQRTRSTFRGFHILDVPQKILSRLTDSRISTPSAVARMVPVRHGPYGGMLFFRSLIESVGLPRADFVLYEDDTEFTSRVTKSGGALWIVKDAEIKDLEISWNRNKTLTNSFAVWLNGDSDFRAFYGFRNGAYSDLYCMDGITFVTLINLVAYMSVLTMFGVLNRRYSRVALLWRALGSAVFGKLGYSQAFPL